MTGEPIVIGCGLVDAERIRGAGGVDVSWTELGVPAPGDARTLRSVFDRADTTFRRLESLSRALVLAATAARIDELLTAEERERAALVGESHVGCLGIDRRYTASLAGEFVEAAIFPYTLPSTSLGEVALRFGLRGPTLAISVEPGGLGESLREARRLFAAGEVRHAVVASVDVLDEAAPGFPASLRAVVAVLAANDLVAEPIAPWPGDGGDPFGRLAAAT
ncbi:MAG: hypothetical protein KDE27_28015 [Planctomycetes bacterium]|nr:hypothetical protein [Planctomycetota bacterium]